MTIRERLHWMFRMAGVLFILASVAFLSAITAMRFAIQGREVVMPDVVGLKAIPARQTLQGRGLGLKIEDRVYNSLPADSVVRQSPPGNMKVKIGQYAHVVLSLGPQRADIPRLADASLRAARIDLLRRGLQAGEISSVYLPGWDVDQVIQQDPPPGTIDNVSPHVNILVSLGPRPLAYVMPNLVGLSLADAEAKLKPAGLKIEKVSLAAVPGATHGNVLSQTPNRGQRVDAGSSIELQVAE
ncbi:MAG TPA: PASTA domain-containing protein [Candidatus Acidoferrales bacterium]|nr:PASTA domain-containing protein [Candidatus Acidoferrales bacterium]